MGEKKVTIMVLKVDLQCEKCYKKVKKVLCKFPQIRDEVYDEKNNQMIIKVVCCSPEKIRDKICCKGGGAIKSIDIKEPEKPKPTPPPADKAKDPEKPKEKPKETPKEKPKEVEKPKETPEKPNEESKPKPTPPPAQPVKPAPTPDPVPAYPPVMMDTCCMECYGGHGGGPCQTGYVYGGYGGAAPYIQYDGYYGRPVYDSYGGGRSYATSSCCVSEENPQACAIM